MIQHTTIEEAISNGSSHYWDEEELEKGRSGGTRCPKCKAWTRPCRKRKNHVAVWLSDCDKCEITDPFKRIWHKFNGSCNDQEREIFNKWLRDVRIQLNEVHYTESFNRAKSSLKDLIESVPFFGV